MEVNHERHDVLAGTPAIESVPHVDLEASHSHPEHGHRKDIAILDVAVASFRADMEDVTCWWSEPMRIGLVKSAKIKSVSAVQS